MKRRGFTLLELIIVLASFGILAAILFAVVTRWREDERRRRNPCQQNIRQIGLAIKQYVFDYDESYPIVSSGGEYYGWADACQPYARNTQLFQCPTDEAQPPTSPTTTVTGTDPNYTDFFYNLHLSRVKEPDIQFIASTIMLGDAVPGDARQHSTGGPSKTPGVATLVNRAGISVGAATRHLDGANYAFADGHVKWLKGKDAATCPAIGNAYPSSDSSEPVFSVK